MSIIGNIGKKYRLISDKVTDKLEEVHGVPCNVFYPINVPNPNANGNYDNINLFATHGVVPYSDTPDFNRNYYIPYLLKKEIMPSPEDVFDTFYNEDTEFVQPYIETSYSEELPRMTKIEATVGDSKLYLMVERKGSVVQSGVLLLRMYLIPMTGELPEDG